MNDKAKELFRTHPAIAELYEDANGIIWTTRTTAEAQSSGKPIKVIKRVTTKKLNKK